jgi:hypothetical protein
MKTKLQRALMPIYVMLVAFFFNHTIIAQSCVVSAPANATINCGQSHNLSAMTNALTYAIVPTNCTPIDISDGTVVLPYCDDCVTGDINIGFNFNYYGNVYSTCRIQTNGIVGFGGLTYTGFSSFTIPASGNPNNYIAGLYADLDNRCGGTIKYKLIGTAPNRQFVVSYENMYTYGSGTSCTGDGYANFQIILNENGSFQVPVSVFTCDFYATTSEELATQGAENINGSYAEAVPGRNATDWRCITPVTQDCHLFNPVPCIFQRWEVNGVSVSTNPNYSVSPTVTTTYTGVWNCGALVCNDDVTVTVNGPTMSATTSPVTSCAAPNGAVNLTLTGFANGTYTVNYLNNGTPATASVTVAGSPSTVSITGLDVGTYSNFSISSGCNSAVLNSTVTISAGAGSSAPTANNVTVCVNGSGSLTSSSVCAGVGNVTQNTNFFEGSLTTSSPTFVRSTGGTTYSANSSVYYDVQAITVSTTGSYTFNQCADGDGHASLYQTTFNPASPATNFMIANDDGNDGNCSLDSRLTATLTAGTTYILVTTTLSSGQTGAYSWQFSGPVGATLSTTLASGGTLEWYTSSSGGTAIATGSPFNPVGVAGSGLANTSTPGTFTYYVACSTEPTCRTAVDFIIESPVSTGTSICAGGVGELTSSTICPSQVGSAGTVVGSGSGGATYGTAYSDGDDINITIPALPAGAVYTGVTATISYTSNGSSHRDELRVRVNPPNAGTQLNNFQPSTLSSSGSVTNAACGSWTTATCTDPVGLWNIRFKESVDDWEFPDASISNFTITVSYTIPAISGDVQWYTTSSGGTAIGTGSPFNPVGVAGSGLANTNTPATYTYYVACSSNPTCRTATDFVINPVSTAPTSVSGGTTMCVGNAATLNVVGGSLASGADWEWFEDACSGTPFATGSSVNVYPSTTTSYYVRASSVGGCPATACASTTVTLPPMGTNLGLNGESAVCVVNSNNFIHFYHSSGRLLASIHSNGQNLGNVSVTSYVDPGAILAPACSDPTNPDYMTSFMRRHWVITPTIQPTGPVIVRLPYSDAELATLEIESVANVNTNDNVAGSSSILLTKYHGPLNVDNNALNNCPATGGNGNHQIFSQSTNGSTLDYSLVTNADYADFEISNFSEFWLHGSTDPSALPVDLIAFTGECNENDYELTWKTASETNVDSYIVLNSNDNISWETVSSVNSSGNSSNVSSYNVTLNKEIARGNYFKLLELSLDGQTSVLSSINVNCSDNNYSMLVMPNPNNGKFELRVNSTNNYKAVNIAILDISGKVIYNGLVDINAGNNSLNLNLENLVQGNYIIAIPELSDKMNPVKFVIKH